MKRLCDIVKYFNDKNVRIRERRNFNKIIIELRRDYSVTQLDIVTRSAFVYVDYDQLIARYIFGYESHLRLTAKMEKMVIEFYHVLKATGL